MKINLEIELLRTFVAFADTGSFKRASKLILRSQPAVSMQMKRFEDLVGKPLFFKKGRDLALTEDGINLLTHARQLLHYHDEIVDNLHKKTNGGKVRIGIPDDYAMLFLPNILKRFSELHPDITLVIKTEGSNILSERLNKGELDIAILSVRAPNIDDIILRKDPIVWVTSHEGEIHTKRPLDLALFLDESPIDKYTLATLQKYIGKDNIPIDYRVVLESKSWTVLTIAALSGFAVATMAKSVVLPSLKILTEEDGFPSLGDIYIVMRATPDSQSIATSRLADQIMDDFKNGIPDKLNSELFSMI